MGDITETMKNQYVVSLTLFLIFVLTSYLFPHVMERLLRNVTKRIEGGIDEKILEILRTPTRALILLMGAYISLVHLNIAQNTVVRKLLFGTAVFTVAFYLARLVGALATSRLRPQTDSERAPEIISKFIYIVILTTAGLIVLDHMGVRITPLVATLGIGGLAVGLALQPTLSNLISGLHTIAERSVKIGDFIEIPSMNISGYVEDVSWRSVKLRTLANQIAIIPNSKFSDSVVINYNLPDKEIMIAIQVGVSYESDLEKVERITTEVAREVQRNVPGAAKEFNPFMRYHTFGDSNINFTVFLRAEERSYVFAITHEFIKALKKRYDEEGVEISWPVRKIHLRDGRNRT